MYLKRECAMINEIKCEERKEKWIMRKKKQFAIFYAKLAKNLN